MTPLPQTGEAITGLRRQSRLHPYEPYAGVVDYIFPAEDEPCIVLTDGTYVFPTLGDTWARGPVAIVAEKAP